MKPDTEACKVIISFSPTNRCNYNCLQCSTDVIRKLNQGRAEVLTPESIGNFLRGSNIEIRILSFGGGGEPTLYKRLPELCEVALHEAKPEVLCFIANGSNPEQLIKVFEAVEKSDVNFYFPAFSLDGLGEVHDQVRKAPGAYDKVIEAIEIHNKLRERDERLVPGISYTIGPWNYKELLKIFYLTLGYRLAFNLRFAMPEEQMGFTEEMYDDIERQLKQITDLIEKEYIIRPPTKRYLDGMVHHARTGKRPKPHEKPCMTPNFFMWIDAYGDVYPCSGAAWITEQHDDEEPKLYGNEDFKLGNMLDFNLREIYDSQRRADVITKLKDCQKCWDECSGDVHHKDVALGVSKLNSEQLRPWKK